MRLAVGRTHHPGRGPDGTGKQRRTPALVAPPLQPVSVRTFLVGVHPLDNRRPRPIEHSSPSPTTVRAPSPVHPGQVASACAPPRKRRRRTRGPPSGCAALRSPAPRGPCPAERYALRLPRVQTIGGSAPMTPVRVYWSNGCFAFLRRGMTPRDWSGSAGACGRPFRRCRAPRPAPMPARPVFSAPMMNSSSSCTTGHRTWPPVPAARSAICGATCSAIGWRWLRPASNCGPPTTAWPYWCAPAGRWTTAAGEAPPPATGGTSAAGRNCAGSRRRRPVGRALSFTLSRCASPRTVPRTCCRPPATDAPPRTAAQARGQTTRAAPAAAPRRALIAAASPHRRRWSAMCRGRGPPGPAPPRPSFARLHPEGAAPQSRWR